MVSPQIPGVDDYSSPRGLWIRQLSGHERSAFIATFGGWMLDGMDVMVYSLVLPTLLAEWHISKGPSWAAEYGYFAAVFAGRLVGGDSG